jgi:hypothetical protein
MMSALNPSKPPRVDLSATIDARSGVLGLLVHLAHKSIVEGFEPSFKRAAEQR